MKAASSAGRFARMAAAVVFATFGLAATQVAVAAPAAVASDRGWIQLAHFSPNTPAVDVYLYSFGNPRAQLALHHVSYGTVSPFVPVAAGEYTVAMRGAGAAPSSKPVLSAAVSIVAGRAYTVAGIGPAAGIRLEVIPDQLETPPGKALVRVIQASMQQNTVTITCDGTMTLASNLKFGSVSSFMRISPRTWSIQVKGASQSVTDSIRLVAGTIHTFVVLDEPGKLVLADLLDAAGSKVVPLGGPQTGFGGTAARPGAALVPWTAAAITGLAITMTGAAMLTRRRRPAQHAR